MTTTYTFETTDGARILPETLPPTLTPDHARLLARMTGLLATDEEHDPDAPLEGRRWRVVEVGQPVTQRGAEESTEHKKTSKVHKKK